jgi:magnesium transporter
MFRVLEVGPTGPAEYSESTTLVGPPPEGVFRWVDLQGQDDAQLEILRDRFNFHPLAIEDCSHFDQRPKSEEYGEYIFVVTHAICSGGEEASDLDVHELHSFLGPRYLVTVHAEPMVELEEIWKRVAGDAPLLRRGADFVYYLVADSIVDGNFPILDKISDGLEEIETSVLERTNRHDLTHIFKLKRALVTMRKALSPQRDVFGLLTKRGGSDNVSERTALYFRDVYDHLVRITESIETNRDLLGNALDAYLSMVSQRTNEIMKGLTLMSAIFLPLAFVVGFFGQNFDDLPGLKNWAHSDALMYVMIATCVSIPVVMVVWFRTKKWL